MRHRFSLLPVICLVLVLLPSKVISEEVSPALNDIPDEEITAPLPEDYHSVPAPPKKGAAIRKYAIDEPGLTAGNFGTIPFNDNEIFTTLMADRLEYRNSEGEEILLWDVSTWVGEDYNKLYFESEGEHILEDKTESADVELLYARNVTTFWDIRTGLRYDIEPTPERFFVVAGVLGLAPQWFEVEANFYLSEDADISADLEAEYDLLLTQRLILQPRTELKAAIQDVKEYGTGSGLNKFELGLRLRYEFSRKFAPYVGISWERKVGETANLTEREGEKASKLFWLAGIKFWF